MRPAWCSWPLQQCLLQVSCVIHGWHMLCLPALSFLPSAQASNPGSALLVKGPHSSSKPNSNVPFPTWLLWPHPRPSKYVLGCILWVPHISLWACLPSTTVSSPQECSWWGDWGKRMQNKVQKPHGIRTVFKSWPCHLPMWNLKASCSLLWALVFSSAQWELWWESGYLS
jgi:hypothetical protein